jgi:hypothetical protein
MPTQATEIIKERRSGTDRRQFSYAGHLPERRSGVERRKKPPPRRSAAATK